METEPTESNDSTPPESSTDEPVEAVPTRETTPVWAQTSPAAPAQRKGDPDWSKTETTANGDGKKPAQPWAQTVPTSPGAEVDEIDEPAGIESEPIESEAVGSPPAAAEVSEITAAPEAATVPPATVPPATLPPATLPPATVPPATVPPTIEPAAEAPLTDPPRAVAADAMKSTWPPASESSPAPPEETDIWPPEPPTERAMPAWPPPSELEEPATPAQAIPSWPDSFDAAASAPTVPPAAAASTPPTITPGIKPTLPVTAESKPPPPAPPVRQPAAVMPPAPVRPSASAPPPPAPAAQPPSGPPGRPNWAPGPLPEPGSPAQRPPTPSSIQLPAWAPRVPLASDEGKPTWFSPKEAIPHSTGQPIAQPTPPAPLPEPPVVGGQLPVAQIPAAPAPGAPGAKPPATKPVWSVVEQQMKADPRSKPPSAEDRSYAEWFAWAKRGGAPASACHAAAQGAFKALSSGKDLNTAVQWATASMSRPPEPVSQARQVYCAWFALANIDLNLDQHRAHLFAAGAIQALDAGQDAAAAHAAGLAAAGIR